MPKANLPDNTERFHVIKIEDGNYIRDYETETKISEELGENSNNALARDRLLKDLNNSKDKFHYIISETLSNTVSHMKNLMNSPSLKDDTYIIDRFEGDKTVYAVCQNARTGKMYDIPKIDLPKEVQEGSVIRVKNNRFVVE